ASATTTATHTTHASSHHSGPATPISHSTAAASGAPRITVTAAALATSAAHRLRVLRLNPNRASTPKVRHHEKGSAIAPPTSATAATSARSCTSGATARVPVARASAATPPPSVSASSASVSTAASTSS